MDFPLNLWPGQDGYDYPLQGDYRAERRWLVEAVTRVARAYPDLRFSLEYKPKEPRTHSYMARAADTLLVASLPGGSSSTGNLFGGRTRAYDHNSPVWLGLEA